MSVVTVQKDRYTVDPLYQWDLNQVLEIRGLSLPSIPEIHFTNEAMDRAIVKQATMNGAGVITVDVPNSLLQKPYKIKAYVCVHEGDTFETLYLIEVPVKARKKPNDYTLEDDLEVYSFNTLENLVNNTVANVEAKCNDAVLSCENIANEVDTKIAKTAEVATRIGKVLWEGSISNADDEETRTLTIDDISKYSIFLLDVSIHPDDVVFGETLIARKGLIFITDIDYDKGETQDETLSISGQSMLLNGNSPGDYFYGMYDCRLTVTENGVRLIRATYTNPNPSLESNDQNLYLRKIIGVI